MRKGGDTLIRGAILGGQACASARPKRRLGRVPVPSPPEGPPLAYGPPRVLRDKGLRAAAPRALWGKASVWAPRLRQAAAAKGPSPGQRGARLADIRVSRVIWLISESAPSHWRRRAAPGARPPALNAVSIRIAVSIPSRLQLHRDLRRRRRQLLQRRNRRRAVSAAARNCRA